MYFSWIPTIRRPRSADRPISRVKWGPYKWPEINRWLWLFHPTYRSCFTPLDPLNPGAQLRPTGTRNMLETSQVPTSVGVCHFCTQTPGDHASTSWSNNGGYTTNFNWFGWILSFNSKKSHGTSTSVHCSPSCLWILDIKKIFRASFRNVLKKLEQNCLQPPSRVGIIKLCIYIYMYIYH